MASFSPLSFNTLAHVETRENGYSYPLHDNIPTLPPAVRVPTRLLGASVYRDPVHMVAIEVSVVSAFHDITQTTTRNSPSCLSISPPERRKENAANFNHDS